MKTAKDMKDAKDVEAFRVWAACGLKRLLVGSVRRSRIRESSFFSFSCIECGDFHADGALHVLRCLHVLLVRLCKPALSGVVMFAAERHGAARTGTGR